MFTMRAPGVFLIWIVLATNAFAGSFNLEATLGGDLGFANYSEAGHHAPAPPVAPSPPNPELSTLASLQGEEPVPTNFGQGTLATAMLTSIASSQLYGRIGLKTPSGLEKILSDSALATIVRNVRREVYSESRLAYMQRAVLGRDLRCKQLASLLGLLTFSDDRIALVQKVGDQATTTEIYTILFRYFPFETDRESLATLF
jgi:hypothetical protein